MAPLRSFSPPLSWALVALVAGPGGGCLGSREDFAAEAAREAIIGGETEEGFPSAGLIVFESPLGAQGMVCSAVAVTPAVLLTAAHCLVPGATPLRSTYTDEDTLRFQTWDMGVEGAGHLVDLESRRLCPSWDRAYSASHGDLALVRLVEPLDQALYPRLREEPLSSADLGTPLLAVGCGQEGEGGVGGRKRSVPMILASNGGGYFSMRHPEPEGYRGLCFGDSGGGSFVPGPRRDTLYGIHSAALEGACGAGNDTSVARYYEPFLRSAILELDPNAETCGDGLCTALESAEWCPADCAPAGCGDGRLDPDEVCDDGNNDADDGCSPDCSSDERCGNGVVDRAAGETCDDGDGPPSGLCSPSCAYAPSCGNGILDVERGEGCDDGNDLASDGCSPTCHDEGHGPTTDCACRAARPLPSRWARALASLL